ncbi:MAG: Gfo/Idh/MocA family oxidoreductase [Acidobacteriota bacterium]
MSSENKRWRIGVIGAGEWGPNHVRNFAALPGAEVVGVADLRQERLTRIKSIQPGVATFSTASEMMAAAKPDAVVVATPTMTHFEVVGQALKAGKHVLSEKPLCLSGAEADELVKIASAGNLRLMVGHVFLFNPGILKIKELITAGHLGRVFYLFARRTNLGPIRSDVNAVLDLATHDISIFNFLLDSVPVEVSAVGKAFLQPGIQDVAVMTLQYPGDVVASIHVSWLDPKKVREITVVGESRMATWDDMATMGPVTVFDKGVLKKPREYADFGEFQLLAREGDVTLPKVPREEPLRMQARAFLEGLNAPETLRSDGRFAADVVRVAAAINESMSVGGAPVKV